MVEISGLEERLDSAMTELLPALRATKVLNSTAMLDLLEVADGFGTLFRDAVVVPRALVGKLWFVFTAMLTRPSTASPTAILDAAWDYQDRLKKIFGPSF